MEAGGMVASTSSMPFWLRTNQFGIVPLSAPVVTLRAYLVKSYARPDNMTAPKKWDWGFGINPVVNAGKTSQVLLPEAYLKGRFRALELYIGRRRELIGLGDSTLSSGFIIWSGNALPVPKVQLATTGYVPLTFLWSFLAINAGYAHAWYNVDYIKGAYLHQKYLFGRFGKPNWVVKAHIGVNHQVQWGGQADFLRNFPDRADADGRLPSSLKAYAAAVTGLIPSDWQTTDITAFDLYSVGNNLGSYDAGLEVDTRQMTFLLYHQHIFEDKSGLMLVNIPDGLTGLSWHRKNLMPATGRFRVNRVVLEFISTLDQSGATFYVPNSIYQGQDNYFNHAQYQQGWSYKGRTIGTPFIAPRTDFRPETQPLGQNFFPNTRVAVWYAGAEGQFLNGINWRLRTSFSRNYGSFVGEYPSVLNQFSALLSAQVPLPHLPGTVLTASLALDQGQMYVNTIGGFLSVKKNW
ncbi:capsule assembly Wzi family protein [Nibrella viscosa]|uniref:Capsule assembly Wzi family protein n=2 Tax=Nibrella viscosa TaxID=1084524 RepID=A0ABP8KTN7_9BACT